MPKRADEMKPLDVKRKPVGMHAAGGATGLYLRVAPSGARNWILRAVVGNRRRDMGLGGYPDVPLSEARERARQARRLIDNGSDPIGERRRARLALRNALTFRECAAHTIEAKRPEWKNAKHAAQWSATLDTYAVPIIGSLPVDQVEVRHVLEVLTPIWEKKTETASRLRSRIESVLAWATVSGYRSGDNPARWRGNLDVLLPKPSRVSKVTHHRAVPVPDMPATMASLRTRPGTAARALEFLVLTAARSGEVRGARWSEIEGDVWSVPADRMKAGKEHRVPLSKAAQKLLAALPRSANSDLVFPSADDRPLSDMALTAVLRRMEVDAVPHGFRSTFRDWASERTNYPRDVAEMALAHTIGDKVEAAYRRGDLFAKRTKMMTDWAAFVGGAK